ncbi:MAG: hypothetical protein A2081_00385 [Elusimicrobia bacterium GWC2_61_19]|nr:MAG: hypothetical protein A2081_00385 [Elusimicrobia bacterium GWC2_61_19]
MKNIPISFMAAAAVVLFSGAARAGETVLPAWNSPVKPAAALTAGDLKAAATGQMSSPCLEACDFDALSAVNDPLYREGSKKFLEQVAKTEEAKPAAKVKTQAAPVLRDAPNSGPAPAAIRPGSVKPHPALKKPKVKKTGPADPLKSKNTL